MICLYNFSLFLYSLEHGFSKQNIGNSVDSHWSGSCLFGLRVFWPTKNIYIWRLNWLAWYPTLSTFFFCIPFYVANAVYKLQKCSGKSLILLAKLLKEKAKSLILLYKVANIVSKSAILFGISCAKLPVLVTKIPWHWYHP